MSFWQKVRIAMRGDNNAATLDQASLDATAAAKQGRIAPPRPPALRSIGNVQWRTPPSRAFASQSGIQGGGGPGNAGAENAGDRTQRSELDVQPSWHYESQYEYFGHARPSNAPHLAGIRANDFRTLGDNLGARQ